MNKAALNYTIDEIVKQLKGEPVFLAGSVVAAQTYDKPDAWSDIDLWCPTPQVLIAVGQKMLCNNYKLDDKFSRVWQRWIRYGFKTWHTNSLRLESPSGLEVNLIYKLTDGHPTTSLSQVLESFDFGLLATGYDLETGSFRDLRSYLFPGHRFSQLPMMPAKRANWRAGFISQYNGLREMGRYAKYMGYGYDLTLVKDDLIEGYRNAELYLTNHFEPAKQELGRIYGVAAQHIELGNVQQLADAAKLINYNDAFDVIMKALE